MTSPSSSMPPFTLHALSLLCEYTQKYMYFCHGGILIDARDTGANVRRAKVVSARKQDNSVCGVQHVEAINVLLYTSLIILSGCNNNVAKKKYTRRHEASVLRACARAINSKFACVCYRVNTHTHICARKCTHSCSSSYQVRVCVPARIQM